MSDLDMDQVQEFAGQVAMQVAGAVTTAMLVLGDRLGLYAALATAPMTPQALAEATRTHERYVREWLSQQAAAGFVQYDGEAGTFTLPAEHAAVLATDDSPAALASAGLMPLGVFGRIDALADAFRTGNGVPWSDLDDAAIVGTERFYRVSYRNSLLSEWIPALDGVSAKLTRGANVADVGTGHGAPLIILATEFPASRFVGYDNHPPSIDTARQRASAAGLSERVSFVRADASGYSDRGFDLICFFDALHDMGDPVSAAAHARHALADDGTLMLVEPIAYGDLETNIAKNPMAMMHYGASTALCVAHSLSEPVGLGLGAQAGEARLREVLTEAGFRRVRRAAETSFNMVLEARP